MLVHTFLLTAQLFVLFCDIGQHHICGGQPRCDRKTQQYYSLTKSSNPTNVPLNSVSPSVAKSQSACRAFYTMLALEDDADL